MRLMGHGRYSCGGLYLYLALRDEETTPGSVFPKGQGHTVAGGVNFGVNFHPHAGWRSRTQAHARCTMQNVHCLQPYDTGHWHGTSLHSSV
eukprot:SAG25_NODE_11731_length_297_cov_0.671717_1_plen_90_part_10